ncbi:MAG: protein-glutamate O-methyltransferase CheR [Lentisphaeraceae bacterium]|nr:protein-glutamate O-methyltransferase CheR [Lentisphaeraceae bacterium]
MRYKINNAEIDVLAPFIYQLTGIVLDYSKAYLFETRLGPILEKYDIANFTDLIKSIALNRKIEHDVIDAITTQETLFFRDKSPFDFIQNKFFPDFFEKYGMKAHLKVWSAASSTGQEIYSIAMTLKNILFDLTKYNIHLFATDISDDAIKRASSGRYNKFELSRGLEDRILHKYFDEEETSWRIKDELRHAVHFRQLNLLKPFVNIPKQHLIFCRNVAIYFSREDRSMLYNKLADMLEENGVLVISSTESLNGLTDRFVKEQFHNATFYRKVK